MSDKQIVNDTLMTDEEWMAEQPWQRARRLKVPPVIDGRRVYYKPYGPTWTGRVVVQSEDGKRCEVQWDYGNTSWVGTSLLRLDSGASVK